MKSDLDSTIAALQALREQYGNIPVVVGKQQGHGPITDIFAPETMGYSKAGERYVVIV